MGTEDCLAEDVGDGGGKFSRRQHSIRGGGVGRILQSLLGDQVNFIVKQKTSDPPPVGITIDITNERPFTAVILYSQIW